MRCNGLNTTCCGWAGAQVSVPCAVRNGGHATLRNALLSAASKAQGGVRRPGSVGFN